MNSLIVNKLGIDTEEMLQILPHEILKLSKKKRIVYDLKYVLAKHQSELCL